jgi:hypothetical protein
VWALSTPLCVPRHQPKLGIWGRSDLDAVSATVHWILHGVW